MSRRPLIAGNWKLHLSPDDSAQVARDLVPLVANRGDTSVVLFPTAISVCATLEAVTGSGIEVGVQNVCSATTGAYTGANSATLGRAAGATWMLAGHSERRHVFHEDDDSVGASLRAGLAAGLLVVLCVGETLDERQANRIDEVVFRQLSAGLSGLEVDQMGMIVLAYEPVWAIGTGLTASPTQAQQVHAMIRDWLRSHYPAWVGDQMRILYGGSVKPHNAAELMNCPDIDGVLVGGASLDAQSFSAIVTAC